MENPSRENMKEVKASECFNKEDPLLEMDPVQSKSAHISYTTPPLLLCNANVNFQDDPRNELKCMLGVIQAVLEVLLNAISEHL